MSMFSLHDSEKNGDIILVILKMGESNSIKTIDGTNLTDQTKFRFGEIIKIKHYFHEEINQRKTSNKKLSKYVTTFDYIGKVLIVLSATSGGVSIIHLQVLLGLL